MNLFMSCCTARWANTAPWYVICKLAGGVGGVHTQASHVIETSHVQAFAAEMLRTHESRQAGWRLANSTAQQRETARYADSSQQLKAVLGTRAQRRISERGTLNVRRGEAGRVPTPAPRRSRRSTRAQGRSRAGVYTWISKNEPHAINDGAECLLLTLVHAAHTL